jgi:beta-N-acetylhexosaminidase
MTAGRLLDLAGAALLGVVLLAAWGSTESRSPRTASAEPAQLSPRHLAGLRVVSGFEGRTPPRDLKRMVARGELAGVILFSDNVGGRKAVRRLTRRLQAIPRPAAVDEPLLVMVDQEGGLVRRLPGPPKPSAEEVGRRGARYARKLGRATGDSLTGMGVNVNLAPVLDVARRGGFIDDQDRAYGRKPGAVAKVGTAFAAGMEGRGVAATSKHFPGLGAARQSTDEQRVKLRLPRRVLRRRDEAPYRSYIEAGGSLVMLSMAVYPALGKGPAALSRRIASRELRRRLGFAGVSITDALDTPAAAAVGGIGKVARRAARAGTDVLLYAELSAASRASRALRRSIASGALKRARAERSANRILELRRDLGR